MKTMKVIFLSMSLLIMFTQVQAQNASTALNNVLSGYFGVKNALITGKATTVNSKAKDLLTALKDVRADELNAEQKTLWTKYADKLEFDSRHISESSDIAHQREHFANLSKNMFEVVKGFKANTSTVYEQYCPMKKATWLSETATIKNPYFGNQMPNCGKTTATIAPSK
jgi:Skp family chaperone for outer membrane proteins